MPLLSSKRFWIPILSACLIAVLSSTEWGTLYGTLTSFGDSEHISSIAIEGFTKPEVAVKMGTLDATETISMIIVTIEEHVATDREQPHALVVPSSWSLKEVKGVHIRDVARSDATGTLTRYTMRTPSPITPVTFTFRTTASLHTLSVSHDSPRVALIDVRTAQKNSRTLTRVVELVKDTRTFSL